MTTMAAKISEVSFEVLATDLYRKLSDWKKAKKMETYAEPISGKF